VSVPVADGSSVGTAVAPQQSSPDPGIPSKPDHPANQLPAELLVGDAYYAAKDQLIHHEQVCLVSLALNGRLVPFAVSRYVLRLQVLLRWLAFEICVDHPYHYLLNFANVMRCSESSQHLLCN
jgi:hypothetical protein